MTRRATSASLAGAIADAWSAMAWAMSSAVSRSQTAPFNRFVRRVWRHSLA